MYIVIEYNSRVSRPLLSEHVVSGVSVTWDHARQALLGFDCTSNMLIPVAVWSHMSAASSAAQLWQQNFQPEGRAGCLGCPEQCYICSSYIMGV